MLDWWQAALLSISTVIAGGSIGLITAYFTQRWMKSATQEVEERQAERRKREEEREAIRQHRTKQLEPISEFLDAAKRFSARQVVERELADAFKDRAGDPVLTKVWEDLSRESVGDDPGFYQLLRLLFIAFASAPSSEMRQGVVTRVFLAAIRSRKKEGEHLADAILAADKMVEQYLVTV